jgi:predicted membrane channel-forming protein YqfA (hemolysin III family)
MNLLHRPHCNKVITLLLSGWLLCVILIIITHWRVLQYFAVLFLVGALLFFMVSILYALIESANRSNHKAANQKSNPPEK